MSSTAIIGTRKGLFFVKEENGKLKVTRSEFPGVPVHYCYYDSVNGGIWAALSHGHWGTKLHFAKGLDGEFEERSCPAFDPEGKKSLKNIWSIVSDSKGRVYIGSEPAMLFSSDDLGESWTLHEGMEKISGYDQLMGGGSDESCLHSICLHPEKENSLYLGISVGGVLLSEDRAETFQWVNKGMKADFLPDPDPEMGFDPHRLMLHPKDPNVLWQQNHCGIYKSTDGAQSWIDLSDRPGLDSAFGFCVGLDEEDSKVAYFVPAISDVVRAPVNSAVSFQVTKDGGESFHTFRDGLPQENAYDLCLRHALSINKDKILFGTNNGNLYYSSNRGESFEAAFQSLPTIYCVQWVRD